MMNSLAIITSKLPKIILDNVRIGNDVTFPKITVISHITSGLTFNPKMLSGGLVLFDKSAFLDCNERNLNQIRKPLIPNDRNTTPSKIKNEMINNDFIENAAKYSNCDIDVSNKLITKITNERNLATPRHICHVNQDQISSSKRICRILRELYLVANALDGNSTI